MIDIKLIVNIGKLKPLEVWVKAAGGEIPLDASKRRTHLQSVLKTSLDALIPALLTDATGICRHHVPITKNCNACSSSCGGERF